MPSALLPSGHRKYWCFSVRVAPGSLVAGVFERHGRRGSKVIVAAIERALDAAGAPVPVLQPRRVCNAMARRGRCSRTARPGSYRCGHHWPMRYPLT